MVLTFVGLPPTPCGFDLLRATALAFCDFDMLRALASGTHLGYLRLLPLADLRPQG